MSLISSLLPFKLSELTPESIESTLFTVPLGKRSNLPDESGIYIVTLKIPYSSLNSSVKVLYVGMTTRGLKSRWGNHNLLNPLVAYYAGIGLTVNISIILLDLEKEDLELIEMLLIKTFDPHLNKIHKSSGGKVLPSNNSITKLTQRIVSRSLELKMSVAPKECISHTKVDKILGLINKRSLESLSYTELVTITHMLCSDLNPYRRFYSKKEMIEVIKAELTEAAGEEYIPTKYIDKLEQKRILSKKIIDRELTIDNYISHPDVKKLMSQSIRKLKLLAAEVGVYRYGIMSKNELVAAIIALKSISGH